MKFARWTAALCVSAGGIWFALHGVKWSDVSVAFDRVRFPGLLLFVPVLAGLEYLFRTERWRLLLAEPPGQRRALFPIVAGAFFMNTVLPFRAGEAARIFWTHRLTGRPLAGTVAALAVDRLMDSLALVVLFLVAVAARPGTAIPRGAVVGLMAAAVAGVAFFMVLALYGETLGGRIQAFPFPGFLRRILFAFIEGAAPLRSLHTLVSTLTLSALLWFLLAGIFLGVGHLFGIPLRWAEATLLLTGIALGVALPSTPGFIGTYEAAGVATLSLLGYPKSVSFPFVASIHLIQILTTALWGTPSVLLYARSRKKNLL